MEIIEITQLKNGRVRIRLEGGLSFLLYKKEVAMFRLEEGAFLSEEEWFTIRNEILVKRAKKRAMYLLQKQDRTEKQLRDKLREGEYSDDVIEEAITYVASYHYIDDERYAANYVHFNQGKKSKTQLKMDLIQRGVSTERIEHAFAEELTVSEEELIHRWLEKKHYDPSQSDEKERRRMYQFLVRKGFRTDEIMRCMQMDFT